ncbi:MAG TPA: hypothetical protein VGW75_06230 [Solirubrobacteraceae bacterium]|nr:hypothetical protein [Solirubrobacteraceae bacterium]
MGIPAWRLRATVLVLVGAVVVHRAVYAAAGVHPDERAHAYLDWLTPALVALLFAGVAEVAVRALRVHRRPAAPPPRGRVLWPALSAALLAIFVAQEAAEALLTRAQGHGHGHELALAELLLAHGAWAAGPAALAVGALLALALRGAAAADAWSLAIVPPRPAAAAPSRAPLPFAAVPGAPRDVLARNLAGRGPPLAVN